MDKKTGNSNKRKRQITNMVMTISLIVVMASGILLHPLRGVGLIKILHALSSLTLTAGIVVHVLQHRGRKKCASAKQRGTEGERNVS